VIWPPVVANPNACVSRSNSPHVRPPSARAVRAAGSTRMPRSSRTIPELEAFLDEAEDAARAYPHREKYLFLIHRLSRAILNTYAESLDQVELE
jgi:hypothetical protein